MDSRTQAASPPDSRTVTQHVEARWLKEPFVALRTYADGALFGERFGTGQPRVVALHGWGRSHVDFDAVLKGLDAISIDLPGFGVSPPPAEVWGAVEYAAALQPVLEECVDSPVLVGHSFGGRVAAVYAAQTPHNVAGLVLAGVPLLHRDDRPPSRPSLIYRLAKWAYERGLISDGRMEEEKQRRGSEDYRAAAGVMRDILVKAVNESYEDELRLIRCPVRLVWGANDSEVPVSVAERAALLVEDVALDVVEGVGHHVTLNAPDRVRRAIEELL